MKYFICDKHTDKACARPWVSHESIYTLASPFADLAARRLEITQFCDQQINVTMQELADATPTSLYGHGMLRSDLMSV